MKENVSLVKRKQKVFSSSVDKYKKLLKKGEIKVQEKPVAKKVTKINERGIVYVGNIPHGFYENQIMNYFKQFGKVSRIRLARSKKTGRSKGYAFVEFKEPEVAKIVAETMNNYLMGKRLLKAQYITPESRQNKDYFKGKNFTADKYPALTNRKNNKISLNTFITEDKMKEKNQNAVKAIYKMQKKLKSLDIHYDFKPVDVPSYLIEEIQLLQNSKNENLNSTENSSDPELSSSQESSDDIVFTPPEQLTKTIKNKINPKKQKLVGIVKKTKKSAAKPATIKDKKASLIKKQIIGKDQIKIKSPKKKKIGK